ncbi:MAG TPA: hypothetical protein VNN16_03095 [Candidatus Sulfotelmatobacter sp.]|nr:hypothetical protein [Candidatus Sulfotelmatobacter sp.]
MKLWRNRVLLLWALTFALTAWGQDTEDEAVRPSGITSGPVRKARAVTAKDKEDVDASSSPVQKSTKSSRTLASDACKAEANTRINTGADGLHAQWHTEDRRGFSDCGGRE